MARRLTPGHVMNHRRLIFIGFVAITAAPIGLRASTCAMAEAAKSPEKPLVEVRESGAYAPLPHPAIIQVYADGRVKTLKRAGRVKQDEVNALMKRLEKLGALKLDQRTLDKEFRQAGEAEASERGGSGFVTLIFALNKRPPVQVSLNQPDQFAKSKAPSVRCFVTALHLIKDFADPPPPKKKDEREKAAQ